MKIIDLLNKIANGEEVPKKIKYSNETFTIREEKDDYANDNYWFTNCFCLLDLNDEVEIIEEEKKIKKIEMKIYTNKDTIYVSIPKIDINKYVQDKINEILDYIKSKGDE